MALKKKTNEWIEGYVYGKSEKKILEGRINKDKEFMSSVCVPKVWFGLREYKSTTNTLSEEHIKEFKDYLTKTLKTHDTLYDYTIDIFPDEQYMRFNITGTRPEPVKEMTIAEIEKELGYKIKVIGDKT